jgi:Secretion system C-terminal sorting domain
MGNSSQSQRTYIGQLLPPVPVGVAPVVETGTKLEVFPNPATETVKFEFPVDVAGEYKVLVRDIQGRVVKQVIQDWLVAGNALLTFNAQHLAAGTYTVSVENDTKQLFVEKLVVNH